MSLTIEQCKAMTPKERREFEAKYWYYFMEECALNEDEINRMEGEEFWWDWDDLFLGGIDFWEECEEWIQKNNDKFGDWDWEAKWFEWDEQRKKAPEEQPKQQEVLNDKTMLDMVKHLVQQGCLKLDRIEVCQNAKVCHFKNKLGGGIEVSLTHEDAEWFEKE